MKIMAVVILCVFVLYLGGCTSEAASVGMIGGADGPTAIFVTSNINWLYICGFIGMIAVLVMLFIYRNKKKK